MSDSDLNLDDLERIAKAATPGPWMLDGMGEDEPEVNFWAHRFIGTAEPNASGSHEIVATSEDGRGPNAEHIATFDPPTVLALIAHLREAESVIERARGWAESRVPGFTVENQMAEVSDAVAAYRQTTTP